MILKYHHDIFRQCSAPAVEDLPGRGQRALTAPLVPVKPLSFINLILFNHRKTA
jgi:hypothetical protein